MEGSITASFRVWHCFTAIPAPGDFRASASTSLPYGFLVPPWIPAFGAFLVPRKNPWPPQEKHPFAWGAGRLALHAQTRTGYQRRTTMYLNSHRIIGFLGNDAEQRFTGTGKPVTTLSLARSEERRVGKECRSRWSPYH